MGGRDDGVGRDGALRTPLTVALGNVELAERDVRRAAMPEAERAEVLRHLALAAAAAREVAVRLGGGATLPAPG